MQFAITSSIRESVRQRLIGKNDLTPFFRHCERSEAIHVFAPAERMDYFATLAMTADSA
jgi:hypothetical protein